MTDESKAKGGRARALVLTGERKSQIGKQGAVARWGERLPTATHKGNFKEEFGIDVECYVLDDQAKTAVISQRGMGNALGMKNTSGLALPRFLAGAKIAPNVGAELRQKLEKPLIFQSASMGSKGPRSKVHGYDVTILIDICKVIIRSQEDGSLHARHAEIARQAHIIVSASAKAGIKGLVYALAGYSPAIEEVIAAFKAFVRDEAREYEKEFPTLLYKEWQRLYSINGPISRNWKGMHLTIDHVYYPLARSQGRILELARESRNATGDSRRKKLHQFLSEVGVKALRTHLGQVLGIARISKTKEQYEENIEILFGDPSDRAQIEINLDSAS